MFKIFFILTSAVSFEIVCAKISVRENWLEDEYGRIRLFHGFNSVKKGPPWFDDQILNETRLMYFKKWGLNTVRLGTMWSGVEPEENKFNETYLNTIYDVVKKLESFGMYVILDVHQDVFSSAVCDNCYDGFPRWLSSNFSPSILKYPWPFNSVTEENWALGYLTYSVSSAFQQFYDNISGSFDKFIRFWLKIVEKFKNENNILGYELLNEPWAGNIFLNPKLLLPGVAGSKNLKPMYDKLFLEINRIDNRTNIFYEPVTWGVFGKDNVSGSGFIELPGGDEFRNRSVFSYHIYCWALDLYSPSSNYPWYLRALCETLQSKIFPTVASDVNKIGGASFLSEFGDCEPDGNPNSINTLVCTFIMQKADEYLQSWTYWDSIFFDDRGFPKPNVFKSFSRPYAMATAGVPRRMKFDLDEFVFEFEFDSCESIMEPTEIFIPQVHYPNGFKVRTDPYLKWKFDREDSVLKIYTFHLRGYTLVKITITPS